MPRYYCDYCDTYLTHDSPSVRKQHNAGYKHKANVRNYYQQFEEQQTQSLIDQRIKEHLGQAAAFQQVGAIYNQHLLARPRLPILPTPIMPGNPQAPPFNPQLGIRPPVLPRPAVPGAPGYAAPPGLTPLLAPPGASAPPGPMTSLPGPPPPTMMPPMTAPGSSAPPASSNGAPSMTTPLHYQPSSGAPATGGFENFTANPQAPADTGH